MRAGGMDIPALILKKVKNVSVSMTIYLCDCVILGLQMMNSDAHAILYGILLIAVYTLVLAKALGLAGATLAGWYGGQIVMSLSHIEADFYAHAVTECAIAAVVCIADMIIGIIGEWLCQLPPNEGPENPKIKEAKRRSDIAQAYKR